MHVHLEAAIAGDIDHDLIGASNLHSEGRRKAIAHGAQTTGGNKLPRPCAVIILRGPHLMLADLSSDNGLTLGHLVDLLADELRHQFPIRFLGVLQRIFYLPLGDLCQPLPMVTTPVLLQRAEFLE